MSMIVKTKLLGLTLVSLAPGLDKTQCLFHLSFDSNLQLMAFREISKYYLHTLMVQQMLCF